MRSIRNGIIRSPRDSRGEAVVFGRRLNVGRKNGKSALTAALVLAHPVGPEAIRNGEIYSATTEHEQAAIVFRLAAQWCAPTRNCWR